MNDFPRTLSHGAGVTMVRDSRRVLIVFASAHDPRDVEQRARQLGLEIEDAHERFAFFWAVSPGGDMRPRPAVRPGVEPDRRRLFCARSTSGAIDGQRYANIAQAMQTMPDVESVDLVYIPMWQARQLESQSPIRVHHLFEAIPRSSPETATWNIDRIHGREAWKWSEEEGAGQGTIVAVIDCGCDTAHKDLVAFVEGQSWGTPPAGTPPGYPTWPHPFNGPPPAPLTDADWDAIMRGHGTVVAGVIGSRWRPKRPRASVAGRCRIMPLALHSWAAWEIADAIRYAADNRANVINFSYGQYGDELPDDIWQGRPGGAVPIWTDDDRTLIGNAIDYAWDKGVVVVAAAGNDNRDDQNLFPARHPRVIACGASNTADLRKSPDGTQPLWFPWGSNYGPGLSLVAPGVEIDTTDLLTEDLGFSHLEQLSEAWPPPSNEVGFGSYEQGNWVRHVFGTSLAAPHVAGAAAACISYAQAQDETLSPGEVRFVLERSAEKLAGYVFTEETGYPHGSRNAEVGYGRLNMLQALVLTGHVIALKRWWRNTLHLLEAHGQPPPLEPPVESMVDLAGLVMGLAGVAQATTPRA